MTDAPLRPLPPQDWDPALAAQRDRLVAFEPDPRRRPLNAFGVWARHPDLLRRWMVFSNHLLFKSSLPRRDCELAVLRTAWRCRSEYEWGHHALIALHAGLSQAEIDATTRAGGAGLSGPDALLVQAVDEAVDGAVVTPATMALLAQRYDSRQLLDLVFLIGHYLMVTLATHTFGVEPEGDLPRFPPS